ncbi:MAG: Calx-beta domain-containing protein, partial [Spirochaetales bacterium]|nr:Calx-beta domain-containing protein [Spirochaetales bacterium]
MKTKLKRGSALTAAFLALTLLFSSCDSLQFFDSEEDSSNSSSSSPSLTLASITLGASSVSADQDEESVTISLNITESDGAAADSVTISGDTIVDTELSDDEDDSTWEGTITPDTADCLEGDTLSFTITMADSTNSISTTSSFTLEVTAAIELTVGAYISQFITSEDNLYAQEEQPWFEITLTDVDSLGDEWYVKYADYKYIYTALSSTNISADLSDGDVIRIHTEGTDADFDDTDQDEDSFGNESIWDFEAESDDVNTGDFCGMFFIQLESGDPSEDNVINLIPFSDTERNTSDAWFSDNGDGVATLYSALVDEGLWTADDTESTAYAVQFDGDSDLCSASSAATEADDVTVTEPPEITLSLSDDTELAEEEEDVVYFYLSRSGDTDEELTVNVTLGGDAEEDEDYTVSGISDEDTVTFEAGEDTASVTITVEDDDDKEEDKTISLTIDSGDVYNLGDTVSLSYTIVNDDKPEITIEATDSELDESEVEYTTIVVTRSDYTDEELTVTLSISSDDAVEDEDYYLSNLSDEYEITLGEGDTTASVMIVAMDDDECEASEDVTFSVVESDEYDLGTSSTATVTINSEDPATVTISVSDEDIYESEEDSATFTISRSVDTGEDLTVNLSI